jgi:calcium-dependent protein kinase
MELVEGVVLQDLLDEEIDYKESEVRRIMLKLLIAIDHIDSLQIAHRDINPSNIIIQNKYNIKLIDFGLCKKIKTYSTDRVGTPGFIAPEILNEGKHTTKVDIFSCGIVMNMMFCLKNPFKTSYSREILLENRKGFVRMRTQDFNDISPE